MPCQKVTLSFLVFICLILSGSNFSVYSHVLSDNPPEFWEFVDEDIYNSINSLSCDLNQFGRLKKKIVNKRNKIKSRNHDIGQLKLRLFSLQSRITNLQQAILEIESKLTTFDFDDNMLKVLVKKIKRKQRKIGYLQRDTIRQAAMIHYKQARTDLIRAKLIQAETIYGKLNASCGSLAGVWQSEGYGYLVDILGHRFRSYNLTSEICISDKSFDKDESILNNYDLYQFSANARKIRVALQDNIPYELTFHRLDALPSQCLSSVTNTPIKNVESFASFFDQHYPFFDLYDVDWGIETSRARALVNNKTSDQALFNILTSMLTNIRDGHIVLEARIGGKDVEFDAHPFNIDLAIARYASQKGINVDEADDLFLHNYLVKDIKNHILGGNSFSDPEEIFFYGMTSGDIGYIAVTAEEIFGDDPLEDIELADVLMDEAIAHFNNNNAKAVIIDLSINYGGFDSVSRTIAERFASQSVIGYSKRQGDFANASNIDITIEPSAGERFLGPIYLITSEATISAGEILVMSLRALPNVIHVGEPTNGALSDQLEKQLPNGWTISLSSEIYLDHKGIKWESIGIEPHILMPVFDLENPMGSAHRDAIDALVERIDKEHP